MNKLLALADRVEMAREADEELEEEAHIALGWRRQRVTSLGLNGRTPGRWLWFPPDRVWGTKGRYTLPSVKGPVVRKRLVTALRARAHGGGE